MIARLLIKPFGSIWDIKEKAQNSSNKFVKSFFIKLYDLYQYENSSFVAHQTKFHSEPFFPHGMRGIFISYKSTFGKNCILHQNVTIGSNNLIDSTHQGSPKIGDNCYIGASAIIIGDITIGDNVRIGANATVYTDVPNNFIVVATNRIIPKKEKLDNTTYQYHKFCDVF